MDRDHAKVFVSYSWDNPDHQSWIRYFTNELRKKGINANCDQFILQRQTKNLNQMMIEGIRDNDFVIYVLTENYKTKSDQFQGGVGFEQLLSLSTLRNNPDKFILIKKSAASFEDVLPFHLEDYSVFDFSNEDKFDENIIKLVYRIYGIDYYEVAPLGPVPDLVAKTEKSSEQVQTSNWLSAIEASIPIKITDLDKNNFIRSAFTEIIEKLKELLDYVKQRDPAVNYTIDQSLRQVVVKLYQNGEYRSGTKIWVGEFFGSRTESIFISNDVSSISNNSYNEQIVCKVSKENQLILEMNFGAFYSQDADLLTPEKIALQIWDRQLKN
ncbi:SEFIR domain-containing protein [Bacillus aerolatus]|nr:SEFIR domain-containing protein [Bacillus aerolatus]